jgi:uncharacterized membrane protein YqgA involved in biofilm formation
MSKYVIFGVIIGTIIGVSLGLNHYQFKLQADKFTKECHAQKGVVIEEYDTGNLLCFPADA